VAGLRGSVPVPLGPARVELDAQQPKRVDAEAHRPLGEAGLQVENEALAPFVGLGFRRTLVLRRVGLVVVAVVAVHVEVAQLEAGRGVVDEGGAGGGRNANGGSQAAEQEQLAQGFQVHRSLSCYCR